MFYRDRHKNWLFDILRKLTLAGTQQHKIGDEQSASKEQSQN